MEYFIKYENSVSIVQGYTPVWQNLYHKYCNI